MCGLRIARKEHASYGTNKFFADAPVLGREAFPSVVEEASEMDLLNLRIIISECFENW